MAVQLISLGIFPELIGIICMLISLVALIPQCKLILIKKEDGKDAKTTTGHSPKELAKKHQLSDNLYRIQIKPRFRIGDKKLHELNVTQTYNLFILEIRRRSSSQGRFRNVEEAYKTSNWESIVLIAGIYITLYYSHSKHSHTYFSFIFAVCKTGQEYLWIYRLNRSG